MAQSKKDTNEAARSMVKTKLEMNGYKVSNERPFQVEHLATGKRFWVHVQGNQEPASWWARELEARLDLLCILVVVEGSRFFVLDIGEFNGLIDQYRRDHPKQKATGFKWSDAVPFEGRWEKLPGWRSRA
jgi:hypothetical protein